MEKIRKLFPRDKSDIFGFVTTVVLQIFVTINDLIAINSKRAENEIGSLVVLAIGLFILFNSFGNMYKAMSVNTTIDTIEVQIKQLAEWKYCSHWYQLVI